MRRAEQWIKTAGLHYDREAEVEDELFGHFGRLKEHAGDAALRAQCLALWRGYRPSGVKVEREAAERDERWRQQRAALAEQGRRHDGVPKTKLARERLRSLTLPEALERARQALTGEEPEPNGHGA